MAEPFHCDFAGRLFMSHLGNHLINAADFHSNDRGFGMLYLNTIHKTWVLSRLAIELEEMPPAYTRFDVETWVESAMRFFTNRDFKISESPAPGSSQEGKVFGYGRSVWAMIDTETRQPADLFAVNDGRLMEYVEKEKECPIAKVSRVKMKDDAPLMRVVPTAYSDIDMNGHVNSVKYIEHALDLWDTEFYKHHWLHRFEIAYVAEAHLGDDLLLFMDEAEKQAGEEEQDEFFVRIAKRAAGDDAEPVEVCRCRMVFRNVRR